MAAAPVWGTDRVQAVVIVAGDPGVGNDHGQLLRWLIGGCLALVIVAGAAGHLLSGRSIRPAVEMLNRQEQFLADAAHELRTPLTTLRLVAEAGTRSPDHARQALRDTVRLADQLGRLVAGLLARTRVQGGIQGIERIALRLDQLVEQVIDDLPPNDADLARPKQLAGHNVTLADGRPWLVPIARAYGEEDGDLRWFVALPQRSVLGADGRWTEGDVLPRSGRLSNLMEPSMCFCTVHPAIFFGST